MPALSFYQANEHRSYPFLADNDTGIGLADAVVVDFGCVMGLRAGFIEGQHVVWLSKLSRSGTSYTFEFTSNAPGMLGRTLVFTRDISDPEYTTQWQSDELASGSVSSSDVDGSCVDDSICTGFLVTGLLDTLSVTVNDGDELVDSVGDTLIEPSLIQNLAKSMVRTINLANQSRVQVTAADQCSQSASVDEDLIVNAVCLTGAIQFKEGYNCSIRVDQGTNSITISGQVGAGSGEACDEVPLYSSETAPDGSVLLTGGPSCGEVLTSINGISGSVIQIIPGDGVVISPSIAPNTLSVDIDLHGMALCLTTINSSVSGV